MTREEFVKAKIKEKGFTIKEYAKHIDMPYSSLLSMLSGNLDGASLENVLRICAGLGISLATLEKPNGIREESHWELSEREKRLLINYRSMIRMQASVNKLLDL